MSLDIFDVLSTTENILKRTGLYEKYEQPFIKHKIGCFMEHFNNLKGDDKKKYFYKMKEELARINIPEIEDRQNKYLRIFYEPKEVIKSKYLWVYDINSKLRKVFR